MKPAENIEKLIKNLDLDIDINEKTDQRILKELIEAHEKSKKIHSALIESNIRRTIMKNPITKLAAAAVIIVALIISITFLDKSATPAYGIEQTIEAFRDVNSVTSPLCI